MAAQTIAGKRVAILATDGVERVELIEPRKALDGACGTAYGAQSLEVRP